MLTINDNTFISELYAYLLLKDNLLKERPVTIGDEAMKGLPDIFTNDKKIGVEVTSVEEKHVYSLLNHVYKRNNIKMDSFDSVNMKFKGKKLGMSGLNSRNNRQRFSTQKNNYKKQNNYLTRVFDESSKEGVEQALEYVVNKKLNTLNNKNSYTACEKIYLFLASDGIRKQGVSINDYHRVYMKLTKEYEKKFDGVFVALNSKLYFINRQNQIKIVMKPQEIRQVREQTGFKYKEQDITMSM